MLLVTAIKQPTGRSYVSLQEQIMKRFVALTMSLIVSILLSSCAHGIPGPFDRARSDGQAEVVTIGFAAFSALRPYYMPLIASFHTENPDLHIQFVSIDEVLPYTMQGSLTEDQRLRRQFGAADTFDLAFFDPTIFSDYLLDLSPLMDADTQFNYDDFYRRAFATSVDDAAHYVLPHFSIVLPQVQMGICVRCRLTLITGVFNIVHHNNRWQRVNGPLSAEGR